MFVRDDLASYYEHLDNPETRPSSSAVHSVFFMEDLRRYIMRFIGPDREGAEDEDCMFIR